MPHEEQSLAFVRKLGYTRQDYIVQSASPDYSNRWVSRVAAHKKFGSEHYLQSIDLGKV